MIKYSKLLSFFLLFCLFSISLAPKHAMAATVVIDPGHSRCNPESECLDKSHGILDQESNNGAENKEVWDVAVELKKKLEAAGHTVIMTKNSAAGETVHLWDRADKANKANAALAVSIHNDHAQPWSWAEIYEQTMDSWRGKLDGSKMEFKDKPGAQALAKKSHTCAEIFKTERSTAEGHTAQITVNTSFMTRPLAKGNIPWVALLSNVPWVYNEVGAKGGMSASEKSKYADGLFNSITKALANKECAGDGASDTGGGSTNASCVITKVGNPKASPPPLPPECQGGSSGTGTSGKCGAVIDWGQKINEALVVGGSGYDKLTKDMTSDCRKSDPHLQQKYGQYWCTILIIDSYALAGIPIAENAGVVAMRQWWKTAKDFKYVDYSAPGPQLKQVQPGFANLMESVAGVHTGSEHVNMIKTISVDDKGNGKITTIDSNSGSKGHTYTVSGWDIKNTSYPVRGFGGK